MRYIMGAFIVWILVRKRLSVYADLVTKDAASSGQAAKGDKVGNPS